jgi:hypothetical protein
VSSSVRYSGNCSGNVSKDAKYSIRRGRDGVWQIEIIYYIGPKEYYQCATREHPALIALVNDAKESAGGGFYINEFGHVLIRKTDGEIYCVGRYHELLEFDISGTVISAQPPTWLKPGDEWMGHHVGRRYAITANGQDLFYRVSDDNHHRLMHLSEMVGSGPASKLARRLVSVKGTAGGRVYINERKQFFARDGSDFIYLGSLDDDGWYPEPSI